MRKDDEAMPFYMTPQPHTCSTYFYKESREEEKWLEN